MCAHTVLALVDTFFSLVLRICAVAAFRPIPFNGSVHWFPSYARIHVYGYVCEIFMNCERCTCSCICACGF